MYVHGLDVLDVSALTGTWLKARRQSKLRVKGPRVGPLAALGRLHLIEEDASGRTWSVWVKMQSYAASPWPL